MRNSATEQVEILQRQLAESQARAQHLERILVSRGANHVGEFIDGLRGILMAAQSGDPTGKANLQELCTYLDQARMLASKIIPANAVPPNGKL